MKSGAHVPSISLRKIVDAMQRMGNEISLGQSQFSSVIDVLGAASAMLTSEGRFLSANSNAAAMLGYDAQDLIGQSLANMVLAEQRAAMDEALEAGRRGQFQSYSTVLLGRSGRHTKVTLYQQPILDTSGQVGALLIIFEQLGRNPANDSLVDSHTTLQSLSNRLMLAHEHDRKRFSAELHDGLGQVLTMIKFMVEDSQQKVARGDLDAAHELLGTTVHRIREAIGEVRRICSELRPSLLDDLGLIPTLEWHCRRFETTYRSIKVEFSTNMREEQLPEAHKADIFRIVQEGMNNVQKHANASLVVVKLEWAEPNCQVRIEDNGVGMDLPVVEALSPQNAHLGLLGMRERCQSAGGEFVVHSEPGCGTRITATWPVSAVRDQPVAYASAAF